MKCPLTARGAALILWPILACSGDPAEPPGTGSLVLEIIATQDPAARSAPAALEREPERRRQNVPGLMRLTARSASAPCDDCSESSANSLSEASRASPPLDAAEVRLTGPTNRTMTLVSDGSAFEGTIDGLPPGSYQVVVVGFGAGEVTFYGRTTNVRVNAGETTEATVAFNAFVTTLDPFDRPPHTFVAPLSFTLVPNATVYRVEVDTDPNFPNPTIDSIPDNVDWAWFVVDVGTYYLRIRAGNPIVPSANAAPSNVESFEVVADTVGDDWTTAYQLGNSASSSGRYTGNITSGDQDWYELDLNPGDQIGVQVLSTSLTPPSNLDPTVRIQDRLQVVLASNDDADSTTVESAVEPITVVELGPHYIGVMAHVDATVGHYELVVSVNGAVPRPSESPDKR